MEKGSIIWSMLIFATGAGKPIQSQLRRGTTKFKCLGRGIRFAAIVTIISKRCTQMPNPSYHIRNLLQIIYLGIGILEIQTAKYIRTEKKEKIVK